MINFKYCLNAIITVAIVSLTSCSNAAENQSAKTVGLERVEDKVCSSSDLAAISTAFLNALKREDLDLAKSFYKNPSYADGEDYGVSYTFFPKLNEYNIFDFKKANAVSPFNVDILGEYTHNKNDGMLVSFIQQDHLDKKRDEKFLSETKFINYFTCYFECTNDDWKITGYRCFEDSGGPFYPICEEGDSHEYCP